MTPLPPLEVTTGMFVASANFTSEASASERATPPPAYMRGVLAWAMTWTASRRSSSLGMILEIRAGLLSWTSSRSTPASGGISIRTGRGRPVRICLNASNTARGTSRGLAACPCHLVTGLNDAGLVGYLVNGPAVLAYRASWNLARDSQHRRRAGVRVGQAGRRVVEAPRREPPAQTPGLPDARA